MGIDVLDVLEDVKGPNKLDKHGNEVAKVTCKAKEGLHLLASGRYFKKCEGGELVLVRKDVAAVDDKTEDAEAFVPKLTFLLTDTESCGSESEDNTDKMLAIGFSKRRFHHMFSVLPQPDSQSIILGCDFIYKSGMGIMDIPIDYPEEPLPRSKDHDITQCQHQHLVKAVKEYIRKCILEAIKKYLQENEALLTGPSCTLPEAVLYLDTGDHSPVFLWLCFGGTCSSGFMVSEFDHVAGLLGFGTK